VTDNENGTNGQGRPRKEDEPRVTRSIQMTDKTHSQVQKRAAEVGQSISDVVNDAVRKFLGMKKADEE
jgi:hypothetical protein